MGYAIFRVQKVKSCNAGIGRQKHDSRQTEHEIQTLTAPEKGIKNLFLGEAMRAAKGKSFTKVFRERTQGQKIRKNAVFGYEGILTFSPGSVKPEALKAWAKASLQWAAETFGAKNMVSAQLHLDESTPHIHFLAIPLDPQGKLNASYFTGSIEKMRGLQDSYAKAMEPFGLQRGVDKKITKARHEDTKQWQREQAGKQERLQAYEAVFGTERDWDLDTERAFSYQLQKRQEPHEKALQKDEKITKSAAKSVISQLESEEER